MLYHDLNAAEAIMAMWVEESLRQAEARRLLRQVQGDRQQWLLRVGARLLYGLGHVLVSLGRQLQRYASVPAMLRGPEEAARW